jgi:hypothetical protein
VGGAFCTLAPPIYSEPLLASWDLQVVLFGLGSLSYATYLVRELFSIELVPARVVSCVFQCFLNTLPALYVSGKDAA